MLELQIASDLHIEYKNDSVPDPLDYILPSADILVLAGDIGSFYKMHQLEEFLKRICNLFKTVIYIPGNQEFYMIPNIDPLPIHVLVDRMYELENNLNNLYILNQSSIMVGDICITGCTLWSDVKINIPKYIVRIYGINNNIYIKKFNSDLNYIKKMINYCKTKNYKSVIITHYCPTYSVLNGSNKHDRFSSLYTSDLDYLLESDKVHTWICGHIHKNFDFTTQGGTRVIGNQLGKPKDNITDYLKNCVVKI